ncbi:MAG: hypothetical protein R3D89_11955 [Sphingomonadaceae bacterium]
MALLALTGCVKVEERSTPAEDAQAVAKVERLSTPPVLPITPQPITFPDIEENNLFGAGCAALVEGVKDPIFLGSDEQGWLMLEGEIVRLSADQSSESLPFAAWSKYIGQENWLTITRDAEEEQQTGDEVWSAPGEIVIHDFADRVVYRARASIECGA